MSSSSSCCCSSSLLLPLITRVLVLFLCFTTTTFGHHEDGQACSDEFDLLTAKKHIRQCKKLRTLGAEFGWNYYNATTTNNTTRIDIYFRAKLKAPSGWVAWGVNPGKRPQMVGTQAIIATRHSNGTMKVQTYNVTKETRIGCALIKPSSDVGIHVSSMSANWSQANNRHNFYIYISATLLLPSDKYNITKLNHVWQIGDDALGDDDQILQHKTTLQNLDSAETINLTTPFGRTAQHSPNVLRSVHGVMNIIGWGTLLPSGVIAARYLRVFPFKLDPTWLNLHKGLQTSGFIIGTIGWAIGLSLGHASKYYVIQTHRTFGILIFTFTLLQMLAFQLRPKPTDDYRKYWNMYHHFLGYGLIAIIVINIFKGIRILEGGPGWKWTYVGILALLGCITLVFEVLTWALFCVRENKEPITFPNRDDATKPYPNNINYQGQLEKPKQGDNNAIIQPHNNTNEE